MKIRRNILIAFLLNLSFAVFEFFGGIFTGSVAIISDALHDIGDAASIGVAYIFERKSEKRPDENYTYGYGGYSVIGGVITTLVLLMGSCAVIYNAIVRIMHPKEINYDGMIIFALVGVAVNFTAAYFTREGDSINQKAVNIHMLEDVFGWLAVLIGAIVMRFTDATIIDPILSIVTAAFIMIHALGNLKKAVDIFLMKTPDGISVQKIKEQISAIENVADVHHIHIWTLDGEVNYGTMHVVLTNNDERIRSMIKTELHRLGIVHSTVEFENLQYHCHDVNCHREAVHMKGHLHHHHR